MEQHRGSSRDGVLVALADTAASWAAATIASDLRTTSHTIHFLRQAGGARLRATRAELPLAPPPKPRRTRAGHPQPELALGQPDLRPEQPTMLSGCKAVIDATAR